MSSDLPGLTQRNLAQEVRDAVIKLNSVIARAAHADLSVTVQVTTAQTVGGPERSHLTVKIFSEI